MDRNMFWDVIDSTNAAGPYPDQETWRCRMTAALEKHTMEEILDWQLILEEYMQSACRQDILAAAAARGVPCLGDGFSQFRAWLIAGGEEVYRNVLEEPDCLADLPGNGDAFQFKGLTLAVYYAYEVQLFRNCPEELRDLYSDLRGRTLDAGILEDIRSGLPQRGDITDGWNERDLPTLFPRICSRGHTLPDRELVRQIKLNELFQSPDQVHAFVEQDGGRNSYLLHGPPQNIADFLADHDLADRVTLTDTSYELIMSVSGSVIDQCPDKKMQEEVTHALRSIQRGERPPGSIFSPTMAEMALWLQSEQEPGQGRMVQMM